MAKRISLKNLVLTDSIGKARTLKTMLGTKYLTIATEGFLKDLPKTRMGIDADNDFALKAITIRGKADLLHHIEREALNARRIYLATDTDYEGEAIAEQYCALFGVNPDSFCRVTIDEFTKDHVIDAFQNAKPIDSNRASAYWTRRTINRLISYNLSPYLWCKIYLGLSINRMQLILLRLLCKSSDAIEPIDYVDDPNAPLTPKTMQILAARDLKFPAGRAMFIARQLYEGLNIEKNHFGLITQYKGDDIRPSSAALSPDDIKTSLSPNQYKLYKLIWDRALRQSSSSADNRVESRRLYDDLSLMLTLDRMKLPWTDTFSAAINGMLKMNYITLTDDGYKPNDIAYELVKVLDENFASELNNENFIKLKARVDDVAAGTIDKLSVINEFYKPFTVSLDKANAALGPDPKPKEPPVIESDQTCDKCGRRMIIKQGRYGMFLACPGYPECKNTMPYQKFINQKCPLCGGRLMMRSLAKGRIFYGCERYPECSFGTWDVPQDKNCEVCGSPLLMHRFKDRTPMLYCSNDKCSTREGHPINKILERSRQRLAEIKQKKQNKRSKQAEAQADDSLDMLSRIDRASDAKDHDDE